MTAPDHFAKAELNLLRRPGPSTYDLCVVTYGGGQWPRSELRVDALHCIRIIWVIGSKVCAEDHLLACFGEELGCPDHSPYVSVNRHDGGEHGGTRRNQTP